MKQVKIVPMAAEHLDRLEQLERMCFSRPWSKKMLAEELDTWARGSSYLPPADCCASSSMGLPPG